MAVHLLSPLRPAQNFDGLTRQLTETLYKSLENFQV
jgi:hypothetical protein